MRRLVVTLDDELAPLLAKCPNQNEVVREALRLYIGDITTDTRAGIIASYKNIAVGMKKLQADIKEIDDKLNYMDGKL